MRFLHTADWHLGHTLHGHSRETEFRSFLSWLLDTLEDQKIDCLLVAGDLFDSANPPASAQELYYSFLADAYARFPRLKMIITAGNHDSPARLSASGPLLKSFGIHVVGTPDQARIDLSDDLTCIAMPFLRPCDLPRFETSGDPLVEGVRRAYELAIESVPKDRRLIAMGHLYMVSTQLSALSERKVLGGNQHALPADIFPESLEYVALGHLHRPQVVARRESMRYSGSPIPLALDEGAYPHQVVVFDLETKEITPLRCTQQVPIIRTPVQPLAETIAYLAAQEFVGCPYLEVCVSLDRPEPYLKKEILQALEGKEVRLCKISPHYTGEGTALHNNFPTATQLTPDEIFDQRYRQLYRGRPSQRLKDHFHELLEQSYQGEVE